MSNINASKTFEQWHTVFTELPGSNRLSWYDGQWPIIMDYVKTLEDAITSITENVEHIGSDIEKLELLVSPPSEVPQEEK